MSTARPPASGSVGADASGQRKRRNLSLASVSIPLQGLSILKRKPLPVGSPVHQQRAASIDSPQSITLQRTPSNKLSPIASPRQLEFFEHDLDKYVSYVMECIISAAQQKS
jgi:hypothetical protein